jgi:hypothetical protein
MKEKMLYLNLVITSLCATLLALRIMEGYWLGSLIWGLVTAFEVNTVWTRPFSGPRTHDVLDALNAVWCVAALFCAIASYPKVLDMTILFAVFLVMGLYVVRSLLLRRMEAAK